MKRIILFAICILAGCISAKSQVKDSIAVSTQIEQVLTTKDSTYLQLMKFIAVQLHPRFKMYKTENIYNLIKLDTATGALWQVQYGMNKSSTKMEVVLDETSLLFYWEEAIPGRFELYPTQNMYTFILLDTKFGYTYQVQWSTNPDQRFRSRIY